MEKKIITEMERNNKIVMTAHGIDVTIMALFCLLQMVQGIRTIGYVAIILLLGFIPVIGERYYWSKDRESIMIKHFAAYGFAVFYTFTVFTANNNLVFLFVIPMVMVISVYNDVMYSLKINIGTILESILIVAIGANTGKLGYAGVDSAIIQIVIMVMVGIHSCITSMTLNANSKQKLDNIMEAQQKTEEVVSNLSEVSAKLKGGIEEIDQELEKLHKASVITKDAMNQVSIGAADTADAVQSQIQQTEEIQNKVDKVNNAASNINDNMHQTLEVLEKGKKDIELLVKQVDVSVENGAQVAEKLETLDKYMIEMHSIVEMISKITSQTSLLALNASIEAARAGEAGRGFAVVATEISGMATQTKSATVNISGLIANVSNAISEVVTVIRQMLDGISEEKQSTQEAAESFENIQSNTFNIQKNMEQLADNIEELKEANSVIVDSIQRISAVSQQVTAHASETMEAEEKNTEILAVVEKHMEELMSLTRQ